MIVNYQQITSGGDSKPYYVVEVEDGEVVIKEDKDGGRNPGLQNARTNVPDHVDPPDESEVSGSGEVVYAVTEDGEFISYDPVDADPPPLRAHLGWYNPDEDELTLLEFVESDQ